MNNRCLIIDEMESSIIPLLKNIGIEPDYRPSITKEQILGIIENYIGIIVRSKVRVDKELLEAGKRLKFIGRAGAGVDNIDEEEVQKRAIALLNAPEGNRDAVGEHTLGLILSLLNKIQTGDKQVRNRIWDREGNRGFELKGKCVALIGYGFMGREVAKRLSAFGCKVLAYDKYRKNYADEFVISSDMNEIFEMTDLISFHIPLTAETKYMVNYDYIQNFKKPVWIINTARGEILKLKDLVQLMKEGKVIGAALDVLENEKLSTLTVEQKEALDYLTSSDNVVLTPHVGGWTFESYRKINEVLVEKIKALHLV
jgi:D-3-phosphoglycerate dehydrogenase